MEQAKILNVIGPGLQRQREQIGWTQNQVAVKCQVLGFDVTRGTLAKIEAESGRCPTTRSRIWRGRWDAPLSRSFPKNFSPSSANLETPEAPSAPHKR